MWADKDTQTCRARKKAVRGYALAALICLGMGLLYERFSHGVISVFMLSFGLYPLVLGSLVDGWLLWRGIDQVNPWSDRLRLWSICTLCTGSFLQGVLEIYGTQSDLLRLYWVTGGLLLAAALVCGVKKR